MAEPSSESDARAKARSGLADRAAATIEPARQVMGLLGATGRGLTALALGVLFYVATLLIQAKGIELIALVLATAICLAVGLVLTIRAVISYAANSGHGTNTQRFDAYIFSTSVIMLLLTTLTTLTISLLLTNGTLPPISSLECTDPNQQQQASDSDSSKPDPDEDEVENAIAAEDDAIGDGQDLPPMPSEEPAAPAELREEAADSNGTVQPHDGQDDAGRSGDQGKKNLRREGDLEDCCRTGRRVGLLVLLSSGLSVVGVFFHVLTTVRSKRKKTPERFDHMYFLNGLTFRASQAQLYVIVVFIFIWSREAVETLGGTGADPLIRSIPQDRISEYNVLPILGLVLGMFIRTAEVTIEGLAKRVFAAFKALVGPTESRTEAESGSKIQRILVRDRNIAGDKKDAAEQKAKEMTGYLSHTWIKQPDDLWTLEIEIRNE